MHLGTYNGEQRVRVFRSQSPECDGAFMGINAWRMLVHRWRWRWSLLARPIESWINRA
jgi:hypothetical protein